MPLIGRRGSNVGPSPSGFFGFLYNCGRSIPFDAVAASTRDDKMSLHGEFDPGSERTLAACLRHASRGRKSGQLGEKTGARESKPRITTPGDWDNPRTDGRTPHKTRSRSRA